MAKSSAGPKRQNQTPCPSHPVSERLVDLYLNSKIPIQPGAAPLTSFFVSFELARTQARYYGKLVDIVEEDQPRGVFMSRPSDGHGLPVYTQCEQRGPQV